MLKVLEDIDKLLKTRNLHSGYMDIGARIIDHWPEICNYIETVDLMLSNADRGSLEYALGEDNVDEFYKIRKRLGAE